MKKNPSFVSFSWTNGLLFDDSRSQFPTKLHALVGENTLNFKPGSTYFVYQYTGMSVIGTGAHSLPEGYFASCTADKKYIFGNPECKAIIVERIDSNGVYLLGGPIEDKGRLAYIDGCTDSLLIAPWKKGEPCLNHLHFPTGINQTPHTHPSIRLGLVARGYGECITPFGNIPLNTGDIFAILPENGNTVPGIDNEFHLEGTHSFRTADSTMDVIAFHPDSDFGPEDENHPMINRTIVNGVSANAIDEIKTKQHAS